MLSGVVQVCPSPVWLRSDVSPYRQSHTQRRVLSCMYALPLCWVRPDWLHSCQVLSPASACYIATLCAAKHTDTTKRDCTKREFTEGGMGSLMWCVAMKKRYGQASYVRTVLYVNAPCSTSMLQHSLSSQACCVRRNGSQNGQTTDFSWQRHKVQP